jgi:hypothetical protein
MDKLVCAFCGQSTTPKAIREQGVIKYRCESCDSLIAAYSNEFESDLRFGNLFNKYTVDKYNPKLPDYVKKVKQGSTA